MKIWIIWYSRMWKIIEEVAKKRWHEIVSIVTQNSWEFTKEADFYIDFSHASWVEKNVKKLCELWVPVVIWTTWWYENKEKIEKIFLDSWNTCIWSWNFSLGVNLFFSIIKKSSAKIDKFNKEYDVMVHEYHHKNKVDSPWWTAIQIWEFILENSSIKNKIVTERLDRKIKENEIHVSSTRGGDIPWTHTVTFDSPFDSIKIEHTARTRKWFAVWSVVAWEKIKTLKPWFYNFPDIFEEMF